MAVTKVSNWTPRAPMVAKRIVGQVIQLDPYVVEKDAPLLWHALGGNDGSINDRLQWYGESEFSCPREFGKFVQAIDEKPECSVNILRLVATNQVVGMASYLATSTENGSTEVGYVAHGEAMARSVAATEAHYLLAKYAIEECGYRRLEWKCDSNNEPSKNAAIRYGYTYEGCFRQHRVTKKGTNRDTSWFSIVDSEWPERKMAMEAWLDPSNFDSDGNQKQRLEHFRESYRK